MYIVYLLFNDRVFPKKIDTLLSKYYNAYFSNYNIVIMTTLVDNSNGQLSIEVINISVCVAPEHYIEVDVDNECTDEEEMSTEEKRRLFYIKRIQNLSKYLENRC